MNFTASPDKGPVVPIRHSSTGLGPFLDEFYQHSLVNFLGKGYPITDRGSSPFHNIYLSFSDFLLALSKSSNRAAELAQCDVAWWTRLALEQLPYKTNYYGRAFVSGMYCGIHVHIVSTHKSMINSLTEDVSSAEAPPHTATQRAAAGEPESWPRPNYSAGVSTSWNKSSWANCGICEMLTLGPNSRRWRSWKMARFASAILAGFMPQCSSNGCRILIIAIFPI